MERTEGGEAPYKRPKATSIKGTENVVGDALVQVQVQGRLQSHEPGPQGGAE